MTFSIPPEIHEGHPCALLVDNKLMIVTAMTHEGGERVQVRTGTGHIPTDKDMQDILKIFWGSNAMTFEEKRKKHSRARAIMHPNFLFRN